MLDERLPWHEPVWRQIQTRLVADRLPHALLLVGPQGLGKFIFARRLAAALLCTARDTAGDACGCCRACHLFQAGSHPDYCVIRPVEEGKAIRVDQIRELGDFLGLTAHAGGYQIALLAPADRLNLNAANSLLKTLEEPAGNGVLLLVTANPARLPPTVRSRCQWVRFNPPPLEMALPWLASRVPGGIDPRAVLEIADGAPLAALAVADPRSWNRRRQLLESYGRVLAGTEDPVRAAGTWVQGDLAENLRWLVSWHLDVIRLKMVFEPPTLANPDLRSILRGWAGQQSGLALFTRLDAAIRLSVLCATTQANPHLLVEAFFGDSAPPG
ncbi:putative DNA polymerase III subunit delta' [Candidatus Competibacter denitrificans Run_A_D11]|uniref:DNA polymerase III subunit delta' n=1 Tax=Candidatus Competibacter denitrificans Run_A_D11 TaxID=1400863 RepID=W6MBB3_9GAMM|nr:DNA polymerase III subunit delta' [Candidatus Competibacter denitrificans]CDI04184.1 putative DNA polymerase III subunit delta' [Candidatus Competibacter denitrificans Run_A_D11]HAS87273.1 DNA polymerase III subunit delta' [Candidatus Competibacteraceae bacterium]HRC68714.1 DNA polymerase III subunit delta' [Candidatus Competibacter denitrificans]